MKKIILIFLFNLLIFSNSYAKHQYEEYSFDAFWKYEIKGSNDYYKFNSDLIEDKDVKKELKNKFSPEFLNRLDDIILFDQLDNDAVLAIVDIELNKFIERMGLQGYEFKFSKPTKEFLAKEGYDPAYGARPVKRAIQKYVEDAVADAILDGKIKEGKAYTISKDRKENKLNIK